MHVLLTFQKMSIFWGNHRCLLVFIGDYWCLLIVVHCLMKVLGFFVV